VEIGHHERIQVFHETSTLINQKIRLTLACNCTPVVCIDEGNQKLTLLAFRNRLTKQLTSYLHTITPAEIQQIIFAYEPGWAIGQKEAAPAEFVHTAHQALREIMAGLVTTETAERVRLIYGGSVSKENAGKIIANADVDGVFIGRFGHEPRNYQAILELVKTGGEQDDN